MQRMTGIDPMFIYSDTPETPMEIAYACVFDPATRRAATASSACRPSSRTRIPTLPPFRRRLMPVPLGLDHPRWVDDPDFDLPTTSTGRAAGARAASRVRAHGRRGDGPPAHAPASRPGRCTSSRGWPTGMVGLIAKVHHSVVDGVAGAQMLAQLLDLTPEGSAVHRALPALAARPPAFAGAADDRRLARASSGARSGRRGRRARSGRTAVRLARCVPSTTGSARCRSRSGRPTPSSRPVGARRAVAFAELDLARSAR